MIDKEKALAEIDIELSDISHEMEQLNYEIRRYSTSLDKSRKRNDELLLKKHQIFLNITSTHLVEIIEQHIHLTLEDITHFILNQYSHKELREKGIFYDYTERVVFKLLRAPLENGEIKTYFKNNKQYYMV